MPNSFPPLHFSSSPPLSCLLGRIWDAIDAPGIWNELELFCCAPAPNSSVVALPCLLSHHMVGGPQLFKLLSSLHIALLSRTPIPGVCI